MGTRRVIATLGKQVIHGVTTDRNAHAAQTIEIWVDDAIGTITVDTSEWDIELEGFWRTLPGFGKYEMNEYGVIRNKRFKKNLTTHLSGGIYLVYLRDQNNYARSRSVAKLYREIFPEHVAERVKPEPKDPECLWWARAEHQYEDKAGEIHRCAKVGPHNIHVFHTTTLGYSFTQAFNPQGEYYAKAPEGEVRSTWVMVE